MSLPVYRFLCILAREKGEGTAGSSFPSRINQKLGTFHKRIASTTRLALKHHLKSALLRILYFDI
jgi:hypothetical protein